MPDTTRPFVDRQEAIERFRELLDEKRQNTPPFLNFHGISGIGKSFLLDYLCRNHTHGWTVIHETFESGGAELDYNGFLSKIIRRIKPNYPGLSFLTNSKRNGLNFWQLISSNSLSIMRLPQAVEPSKENGSTKTSGWMKPWGNNSYKPGAASPMPFWMRLPDRTLSRFCFAWTLLRTRPVKP